ncbi:eliciting plant response-like protein [Cyathus striatus]|nr:eliciting plant response-like protein [Cyathus striatus]
MKFAAFLPVFALFISATAVTVAYGETYDNPGGSLATVACSDGPHGLLTRGFKTFGDLPRFPHIGAASAVTGYGSPSCGTCWSLSYTNDEGKNKSISVLAIDHARTGFNIARAAMDELTGNQAVSIGRVDVTAVQVANSFCGL